MLPVVAKSLMSVSRGGLSTSVSNATVNYYMFTVFDQVCTVCTYTHTHQWSPQEKEELRGCLLILILLFPKSAVTV